MPIFGAGDILFSDNFPAVPTKTRVFSTTFRSARPNPTTTKFLGKRQLPADAHSGVIFESVRPEPLAAQNTRCCSTCGARREQNRTQYD